MKPAEAKERQVAIAAIANAQRWLGSFVYGKTIVTSEAKPGKLIDDLDLAILLLKRPPRLSLRRIWRIFNSTEYSPAATFGFLIFYVAILILLRVFDPGLGQTEAMVLGLAALISLALGRRR